VTVDDVVVNLTDVMIVLPHLRKSIRKETCQLYPMYMLRAGKRPTYFVLSNRPPKLPWKQALVRLFIVA
jgi:hypothetical protein